MYHQAAYAETDLNVLHDCMRQWSFATLVTSGTKGIQSTPLPFLLNTDGAGNGSLTTHLSLANPIVPDLRSGAEVLVIFQGPHAFISPSWYQDQMTFPTWNYTLIHARGVPVVKESEDEVMAVLRRTVAIYDTPLGGEWDFEKIPMSHTGSRLSRIAAIEIPITTLEGKLKLNQDKSVADRLGVIAQLSRGDGNAQGVAEMIRRQKDMA
ncbi:FMN-binding negative transcriptional regulator [Pigmentiphaga aceris]|uniref:FMN-binding negative transcriptional regulator n=1 Tax=Pigmentiphaga aceris TaxID=1940612 RepID=A0A5C0B067_9BURK|nr:FMN-binding negative transcriptional regulator [Pigmentiphaga aceris]QEI06510.1 FMN-binding negative transcriptional regulator [Pigmentiphaga aceris]